MNMVVHVSISFLVSVFVFFRKLPRSGIAWSHSSSTFSFLWNLCDVFHSGFTNLPTGHNGSLFSTSSPTPFISYLFGNSYLICISLMISDVEDLVVYLLAICMSSLEKCLFISPVYFFKLDCSFFLQSIIFLFNKINHHSTQGRNISQYLYLC